ncbi:ATP-binding protein [Vulcanisaeta distributa]|uniref:ATPase n=1 Tax=Vulcanisaeta distributa (strain DSM 14429 / JCM 11212 / NBRC 100878 / IC-017) TaxID=572478 RepID=E1QUF4_VULDI|nr:ATP-binding protein [Vulcanisaeta distributa]ADN49880.1 ATPase [Vulcanisaeta distributa DSM 14429]
MRRIELRLANVRINFVDRDSAIKWIEQWIDRGMALPHVVYGPEGCGKTAWLMQSAEVLRDHGFEVIYVNPIEGSFIVELGIEKLRNKLMDIIREATSQLTWGRVAWAVIDVAREAIEARVRRLAVIVDDAFQVIGLDRAAIYVKGLLGLLEHPPANYESMIAIAATSEGVSLREIGRHSWSDITPIWNMPKEGFEKLYEQIPGSKPPFEEVWGLTGGNPRMLERLYERGWNADKVIEQLILDREVTREFIRRWRREMEAVLSDPDYLWNEGPRELANELIKRNLIIYGIPSRDPDQWVDTPPPEKDEELGIGRYVAWQSPLHREAVRRALQGLM